MLRDPLVLAARHGQWVLVAGLVASIVILAIACVVTAGIGWLLLGAAAGIGCSLALAADFCIAGESGYFLQAFVNIGLVPDGGASWMLARLVGKARATEMMLLGERVYGPRAAEWGLIHKCVPDVVLMEEAMALATRLAAGPTVALGLMRQGLAAALESDYATAMAGEAERQSIAGQTEDAREGAISFLQKRKAEFKGA